MSDVNIGSVNERMRRASVREVVEAVRVASLLSADPMTIHPGHLSPLTRERPEILTKQMLRSLNEIDKAGIEYGVDLCLENMPNFPFAHCKSPKELLQAVEGTDLFFTLDIGHAHTNNNMAGFLYPEIVDRVKNVHVHDNLSDHDSHLTLGQGDIDLPRIILELEGLGYRGNYIIESRTLESSKSSKVYLTEIGDLLRC
jgi:sugar phosphate isomerase/epimerase